MEASPAATPPAPDEVVERVLDVVRRLARETGGEEARVLGPGEVAHIPANVSHSIESLEDYVQVLDVFAPLRPDIIARLKELSHP